MTPIGDTLSAADGYRVTVGYQRWYRDPLPACAIADADDTLRPSVTTVKKAASSDWSPVTRKRLAHAYAANPDVWAGLDLDAVKASMSDIDKGSLAYAASRGTNVHTIIEDLLYGRPVSVDAIRPGYEYLATCQAMLADLEPELLHAECVIFNRTLNGAGFAGTADAIARVHGKTYLIDWKSRGADSGHKCYGVEKAQLGLYAAGEYLCVDGERHPFPHIDGVLIVSIMPDSFAYYVIDIDAAKTYGAKLHAWWTATNTEREGIARQTKTMRPKAPRGSKAETPALDWIDDPAPAPVALPDEGDDLSGPDWFDAWNALEVRFDEIVGVNASADAWFRRVVKEARLAGVGFARGGGRTARRYEIYRGLIALAGHDYESDTDRDEITRALAAFACDSDAPLFPTVSLGHAVGSMDVATAKRFAECVCWSKPVYGVDEHHRLIVTHLAA